MKQFTIVILLCMLFLPVVHAQDITPIGTFPNMTVRVIDITKQWSNTGLNLTAGQDYVIIVNGIAATNRGTTPNTALWIGPEGIGDLNWNPTNAPLPTAAMFSVIGKIGNSGQPFYVGRNCPFTANTSGQLYLGYNDTELWENFGYYVAYIFYKPSTPIPVAVEDKSSKIVNEYNISQNYPNPFNPETSINLEIPNSTDVHIVIYDINGQKIRDLLNVFKNSGNYTVSWNGKDNFGNFVPSGTYYYQVKIGNFVQSKKMIFLK